MKKELNETKDPIQLIEVYILLSESGHFRFVSTNCFQLLGYEQQELIGKNIRHYVHEEDIFLIDSYFYNDHHLEPLFLRLVKEDGSCLWVEATVEIIQNQLCNQTEIIIKIKPREIDYSLNDHLPTREQSLPYGQTPIDYAYLNDIPTPIVITIEDSIVFVNHYCLFLLGAKATSEIVGKKIEQFIYGYDSSILTTSKKTEQKWKRLDGQMLEIEMKTGRMMFKGKDANIMTLMDITSRKSFQKLLQKNRERYQRLIQNSVDTIAVIHENKWVFINESGLKLFNVPNYSNILGHDVFSNLNKEYHSNVKEMFSHILCKVKEKTIANLTWATPNQQEVYTEMISLPTTYFGEPAVQVILRDLSERKQAEELMLQSEKLSVAGQLAAGIAHEIRNPLTAIKGFLQLMRGEELKNDEYVDIVFSELNRVELILSELLLLAKPQKAQLKEIAIHKILNDVITLLETEANMKNVQIVKDIKQEEPIVCDENQIKQVFINLIKNAIEAMPNGGKVNVELENKSNHEIVIKVVDEGEGIPDHLIKKLGEPFITTKPNGTGLGLMITYKIIHHHQGAINVYSKKGKGTTFEVLLPKTFPFEEVVD
ncbi:PAS domain S-box protein [Bacillus carboniphilus]|uniref:histidine kinase n=1 Tax=Bacillus carboniphilus TaxID=86663 RepID=A0ABY9JUU1_9BACI|nr:ATP-binding protein [Bacillus carboniphilus]WLR43179.1 PAS domain S-box protein [Bacillus carboniphilus]